MMPVEPATCERELSFLIGSFAKFASAEKSKDPSAAIPSFNMPNH